MEQNKGFEKEQYQLGQQHDSGNTSHWDWKDLRSWDERLGRNQRPEGFLLEHVLTV